MHEVTDIEAALWLRGPTNRTSIRREARFLTSADTVWEVVGDPGRLASWWPGVTAVRIEDDIRTITTASGLEMPERIVTLDPVARRFQYRLETPLFREHLSTIDVIETGDEACLAVYSVDADPAIMALVIAGAAATGLRDLASRLTTSPEPNRPRGAH